jgi:hypothetical protein
MISEGRIIGLSGAPNSFGAFFIGVVFTSQINLAAHYAFQIQCKTF